MNETASPEINYKFTVKCTIESGILVNNSIFIYRSSRTFLVFCIVNPQGIISFSELFIGYEIDSSF